MTRFEGYQSERQVRQRKEQARAEEARQKAAELSDGKHRSLEVLRKALPLLVEYGQPVAMPAEIPTMNPFNRHRVVAAWMVKSFMSAAGNGDYGNQSASLQAWALTEDGLYGQVGQVDRGVPALKFWERPSPLNANQLSGGTIYGTDKQEWQLIEKHVSDLLSQVGVDFKAD